MLLDRALEPVRVVRTVAPLTHTDIHDFVVRENGNVAFIAYEPARRDLSAMAGEDGTPYGRAEAVEDSVIQEVAPDGREVMRWNSWEHLAAEDCTQHRFPSDYAHANSLQYVEGDIVANFRGCSQVLRIDGESGEVVWRLGRSHREWPRPPLAIVGDPYGEFCGQHSARLLPEGRLLLFDNGGHCQVDPSSGRSEREGGEVQPGGRIRAGSRGGHGDLRAPPWAARRLRGLCAVLGRGGGAGQRQLADQLGSGREAAGDAAAARRDAYRDRPRDR